MSKYFTHIFFKASFEKQPKPMKFRKETADEISKTDSCMGFCLFVWRFVFFLHSRTQQQINCSILSTSDVLLGQFPSRLHQYILFAHIHSINIYLVSAFFTC